MNASRCPPRPAWVLLGVVLLLGGCNAAEQRPAVQDGVVDLRQSSLDSPIALNGTWLAQPVRNDAKPGRAAWRPVAVPGYFERQGFPDDGAVWYRLELKLPPDAGPLKGYVQHANNAHAVYVEGPGAVPHRLATSGAAAAAREGTIHSRAPVTFSIPRDPSVVLLWKVSNFDYLHGGPFHPMYIGTEQAIDQMVVGRVGRAFLMLGVFLLIGVTFLLYWWMNRAETESLVVSGLALIMAVRVPVQAGVLEYFLPAVMHFEIRILLEAVTFLLVPGLLGLLLWYLFPLDMRPVKIGRFSWEPHAAQLLIPVADSEATPPTRSGAEAWRMYNALLVAAAVAGSVVFTLAAIVVDSGTTSLVMGIARWYFVPLALSAVLLLGQVLYRRRPLSRSIALGTMLLIAGGVHDILISSGAIEGNAYLGATGVLAFVLTQTFGLMRRFAHAADTARHDAETLKEVVSLRTKELRAATIAAHAANLAKSHFLSAVSHELRSPLASILGYNRILQEELSASLEPQQREFFETIQASGERLTGLVNDILDVAKIEAGMLNLTLEPVDCRQVANDVVDQVYPISRDKGLSIRVEFGGQPAIVLADAVRLRQVLLNLVSNALKFTGAGEVVLSAHDATLPSGPGCAIAVTDTGPGISPDFLPHVFDRFTQDEHLYNETQRGTGLGLSIARELVTRMNGTIDARSVQGHGATFTVTLPRAVVAPADSGADSVVKHQAILETGRA